LIRDHYPDGVLTFVGNRKYESFLRRDEARRGKIARNSYIPQQVSAHPINNWIALLVWLYIFREQERNNFNFNPLYELGYERVGCIPCPANKLADIEILKTHFPEKYDELWSLLREHAEKNEYPEEWMTLGFWRWKKLPKSQTNLMEKLQIAPFKAKYGKNDDITMNYTVGMSPCKDGSVVLEGHFNTGLDLERVSNFLEIFGKTMLNLEHGILNVKEDLTSITIFSDGSLNIRSYNHDESELINDLKKIVPFILKAQKCIGCGLCIELCTSQAIYLKDEKAWMVAENCTKCLECIKKCPILKFSP